MFQALTKGQAAAAKQALGQDIKKQKDDLNARFFNFDIAKLMCVSISILFLGFVFLLKFPNLVGLRKNRFAYYFFSNGLGQKKASTRFDYLRT